MTAVITGDLVASRKLADPKPWLSELKALLAEYGDSPGDWDIYRGDSFQVEVEPEKSLLLAIRIKATIKSIRGIDVRMAIGIGAKDHAADRITESNGEAFIFSGELLENLKKDKQRLAIRTRWEAFDREMNLCLRLALIAMDHWSRGAAEMVKISLLHPDMGQEEKGKLLGITQSSVSERQSRAYLTEILDMEHLFREKLGKMATK